MRISWGGWLATASLAAIAAGQHNTHVIFTDSDFQNPLVNNSAVLTRSVSLTGDSQRAFRWAAIDTPVENVTLWADVDIIGVASLRVDVNSKTSAAPEAPGPSDAADNNLPPGRGGKAEIEMQPRQPEATAPIRASPSEVITANVTDDGTHGFVIIADFDWLIQAHNGQSMYFQINWAQDGGSSYSRYFTVAADLVNAKKFADNSTTYNSTKPALPESLGAGTSTVSASVTVAMKTTVPISPSGSPSSSDSASGKSGGGGLTKGAIAGIAVGAAVAGILAAGALIWLLIFRRRRRQQASTGGTPGLGGPYGSNGNSRTQELMAEKEASAGVDVSPHSPYSDDGNNAPAGTSPAVAAAAAGASMSGGGDGDVADAPHPQSHDRSLTPYSDHQASSPAEDPHSTTAPVAGAQGRSTPYVHLVEDGMTEDDIRRLEAEERELDQAIEQAARR